MTPRKSQLEQTARHLNSAAIHLLRGLRAVDRTSGLTPARLSALSVVVFGGPSTLGGLARAEDVAGPTMTRIVDGLVARGLVSRTEHPDSARQVLISATGEGRELMLQAAQRRIDVIVAALLEMPADSRHAVMEAAEAIREVAGVATTIARKESGE